MDKLAFIGHLKNAVALKAFNNGAPKRTSVAYMDVGKGRKQEWKLTPKWGVQTSDPLVRRIISLCGFSADLTNDISIGIRINTLVQFTLIISNDYGYRRVAGNVHGGPQHIQ